MQYIDYGFDQTSNVTKIYNSAGKVNGMGGEYRNFYEYDKLHRLISSSGDTPDNNHNYEMKMQYTPSGRIVHKQYNNIWGSLTQPMSVNYGYCDYDKPLAPRRIYDEWNSTHTDLRWD